MYSGIVAGTAQIVSWVSKGSSSQLSLLRNVALGEDLAVGGSVSIEGVCLTVVEFDETRVTFDLSAETLRRTTLVASQPGRLVNIERPLLQGAENGGHPISGHVDGTAQVDLVAQEVDNLVISFSVANSLGRFLFNKGFVALNGVSLTISDLSRLAVAEGRTSFKVWLIPETLRRTNLGGLKAGDQVNLELDRYTQVIVETVVNFLASPESYQDLLQNSR